MHTKSFESWRKMSWCMQYSLTRIPAAYFIYIKNFHILCDYYFVSCLWTVAKSISFMINLFILSDAWIALMIKLWRCLRFWLLLLFCSRLIFLNLSLCYLFCCVLGNNWGPSLSLRRVTRLRSFWVTDYLTDFFNWGWNCLLKVICFSDSCWCHWPCRLLSPFWKCSFSRFCCLCLFWQAYWVGQIDGLDADVVKCCKLMFFCFFRRLSNNRNGHFIFFSKEGALHSFLFLCYLVWNLNVNEYEVG